MSKVLAIDTSTSRTSVAIIDGDTIVFSGFRDGATAHGPSLPALVQEALAVSDVAEVIVGMGPGPFTGLRVGIAFAQSFALAREIPVRGVCSLDAIAAQIGAGAANGRAFSSLCASSSWERPISRCRRWKRWWPV